MLYFILVYYIYKFCEIHYLSLYTVTTLYTLNNTIAKGFNQMATPPRIITVALDMSKDFDTIKIYTLAQGGGKSEV